MIRQQSYPFGLLLLLAFRTVSNNDNVAVNAYDWTCNLFCYNKGVCRHGHEIEDAAGRLCVLSPAAGDTVK